MHSIKDKFIVALVGFFLISSIPTVTAAGNYQQDYVAYRSSFKDFKINLTISGGENFTSTGEDSGRVVRGWADNTYIRVEPFIDTRQVIDHYKNEPIYGMDSSHPFWSLSSKIRSLSNYDSRTLNKLRSSNTSWWLNHSPRIRFPNWSLPSNSFQNFRRGFRYFQGFKNWHIHSVEDKWGNTCTVRVPHRFRFLTEVGKKKIPVYKEEEYTRYRTTKYQIVDNWPQLKATVILTGSSGYEDNIRLSVETDNRLLNTNLENKVVHVGSTSTTNLILSSSRNFHGSIHTITVTGTDFQGRSKSDSYELDFRTVEKTSMENGIVNRWESDFKPSEKGTSSTQQKKWVGVNGKLRSANTGNLLLHGSDSARVNVRINGNSPTPAAWLINSQYNRSSLTYEHKEWNMKLRANADGHQPKKASVRDSTSNSGTAGKNFSLLKNPYV